MDPAIVFDDGLGSLAPLTDLRASFDIRTGAYTTLERLQRCLGITIRALFVPHRLGAVTRERHQVAVNIPEEDAGGTVFVINGRCVHPPRAILELSIGESIVEEHTGHLVAARVASRLAPAVARGDFTSLVARTILPAPALLARPWHIRTFRGAALRSDLADLASEWEPRSPSAVVKFGEHPVAISATASIYPSVILDTEEGAIAIADHATIRPGAIIRGPAYIGPHTTIADRAVIKSATSIGPWCKIGGEVGGTMIQGFANKSHEGYLGDSWLGEWVNLGAGTTSSNLLNTYGEVSARASPDSPNEKTGLQYLGCVLGDHVKTAILTRIMTGAIVGTGTMWAAGTALTGWVPPFTWATDEARRTFRFEKFLKTARAMMSRREIEPSPAYVECLAAIHAEIASD